MKRFIINKFTGLCLAGVLLVAGCTKTSYVPDPNNPTVESVLQGATRIQIDQLGVGLQSVMRNGLFSFYSWSGSVGREVVYFAKTESRYYRELQGEIPIDPVGIMYDWWFSYNQTRRRAEILLQSANNTSVLTAAEKSAVTGFAKTVQAYVMLNALNMEGTNGIRTSFSDLNSPGDLLKPGCFADYAGSLAYIKTLAEEGKAALAQGGASFPFKVSTGWTGFNTPATFLKFNRAVAARIAMYQKDWAAMNQALTESFLDLSGPLTTGPTFLYSTTAGDIVNPIWQAKDEANNPLLVQVNFVPEAEAGDTRVFGPSRADGGTAKVRQRVAPTAPTGYPTMNYETQLYATNTSPISIIRNEELILMYAEAKIQTNQFPDAVIALNRIRTAHNLAPYSGPLTQAALIDELLRQRRYSLFMEGHRWFDMRRYERLNTLPKDRPSHNVLTEFPRHKQETDWDAANPC